MRVQVMPADQYAHCVVPALQPCADPLPLLSDEEGDDDDDDGPLPLIPAAEESLLCHPSYFYLRCQGFVCQYGVDSKGGAGVQPRQAVFHMDGGTAHDDAFFNEIRAYIYKDTAR